MSDRVFVDSNVFLYALDVHETQKSPKAVAWVTYLLRSQYGVSNLQVMNEVTNVLIKRRQKSLETIFAAIDTYSSFGLSSVTQSSITAARLIAFETRYSWWDCSLLASAIELGCRRFLSEDLRDGHAVRGLTIMNPFRHSPPQLPVH